jgi:phenylalanyl-tRNA synthetase beta chain
MANIKFSRKIFEKEIGKLDEAMQTKIAMFGTTLESFNDDEIELEIFPNRPDLLSYQGFKRSFLAFLGKKTGLKKYKIYPPEKDFVVNIDSSVKNVRPYTACAIVKGLKFDDEKIKELIEIQEKLHFTVGRNRKKVAIGIYPLEKIKLPITFEAKEPDRIKFIPLESEREMTGLEILQRHPTGRDYAHLLAGKEKFPIFIDSAKNILSMPPIINSKMTGKVDFQTTSVFIECSGHDFDILKKCINILVSVLADMGGKVYQMKVGKEVTPDFSSKKMKISVGNTNKLLGLDLTTKEVKNLVERMGYDYDNGNVEVPSWRTDILHEVDLIEDVAIAYGYENFVPEIPDISTIGEEDFSYVFKRKISEILSGLNFLEVSSYHLTSEKEQFSKMGILEKQGREVIKIEDSKTDYSILRKDLSHCLLRIFSENVDSEYPQFIFEAGKVFNLDKKVKESEHLAVAMSPKNFTEAKQVLEYLFRMLELDVKLVESDDFPSYFVDGRVAKIMAGGKSIGFIGEIHPKILKNWKIKMPVALFEINLDEVIDMVGK